MLRLMCDFYNQILYLPFHFDVERARRLVKAGVRYEERAARPLERLQLVAVEPYLRRARALSSADTSLIFGDQNWLDVIAAIHLVEI